MTLEGQVSNVLFYLALAVSALFFLCIVVQYYKRKKLEKELDAITLHYQQHIASSRPKHTDLFAQSPYPVCVVDRQGNITGTNLHFMQLVSPAKIGTVQEFDRLARSNLENAARGHGVHTELITVQDTKQETFRQFMVVSWPMSVGDAQVGRVISLHEQTNVIRRKNHQAEFERELIECMQLLSTELTQALHGGLRNIGTVQSLNTELGELSEYLLSLHTPLRQQATLNHKDIVPIVKEAVAEVRQLAKEKGVSFAVTLPHTSGVKVEAETFKLAVTTVLTGLLEFGKGTTGIMRIHIESKERKQILTATCEDLIMTEGELAGIFAFGGINHLHSDVRNLHLRATIARELCEKQGIILSVASHPDTGTIFTFKVAAIQHI